MFGQSDDDQNQNSQQGKGGKIIEPLPDSILSGGASKVTNDPTGPPPPRDHTLNNGADQPKNDTTLTPPSQVDKPAAADDLLAIKQQALQSLQPLVSHLDQNPEEKFKTTMMMIQATDDQSLLKDALEAAKSISDDKERAQALLDVINEINYFTQNQNTD